LSISKKDSTNLYKPVSIRLKKDTVKKILKNGNNSEEIILDMNSLNIIYSPKSSLNLDILYSLARSNFESNSVELYNFAQKNISWIIDIKRTPFTSLVNENDLLSNLISLYAPDIGNKKEFLNSILNYVMNGKININKNILSTRKFPIIVLSIFLRFDILLFDSYESLELGYYIFKDLLESKIIEKQYNPIFLTINNKYLSDKKTKNFKNLDVNLWHLQV